MKQHAPDAARQMLRGACMNEFQNQKATVKDSVSTLVDQGHQTVDAIKSKVSDVGAQVRDNSSQILDATRGYVQAHPIKALGIALGLGYVAMRIRTSPVMELAFLGAFGYLANRVLNKGGSMGSSMSSMGSSIR
jgi:ElaB/YqjD/DUF883 family membrane-anchored ribosome-binding protein